MKMALVCFSYLLAHVWSLVMLFCPNSSQTRMKKGCCHSKELAGRAGRNWHTAKDYHTRISIDAVRSTDLFSRGFGSFLWMIRVGTGSSKDYFRC